MAVVPGSFIHITFIGLRIGFIQRKKPPETRDDERPSRRLRITFLFPLILSHRSRAEEADAYIGSLSDTDWVLIGC